MELPDFANTAGWGPTPEAVPSFSGLPFTPFSKRDTITYVANWDPSASFRRGRRNRTKFGDDETTNQLGVFSDEEQDAEFEGGITVKKRSYETLAKYRRDRTGQQNKLSYAQNRKVIKEQQQIQNAPISRRGTRRQVANKKRRKKYIENQRPVVPSIKKMGTWIDLTDIWFRETFEGGYGGNKSFIFTKEGEEFVGSVPAPRSRKLLLCGTIHGVLTKYDTRQGNTYKPELLNYEAFSDSKYVNFNHKSATQDPNMMQLVSKGVANIYTTENVMSAIMCCNRSKYSFDIVIDKIGDTIFLEERSKVLSQLSVDETSQNRPTRKGSSRINQWTSLCEEATYINHVFREQMVFHNNVEHTQRLKKPHPFIGELQTSGKGKKKKRQGTQQAASQAFSYNLFEVADDIRVVCRCGIDGYLIYGGNETGKNKDWVRIFATNQYDPNKSKTQDWSKYLESRNSTILSQEMTNNNFKFARWGIKAHLSDAKYIKLGFVTRNDVHSTEKHLISGVKTYDTNDFIRNKLRIRSMNEPWTIFAKFVKSVQALEHDGKYVAVRDPLKQVIRMYKVPDDALKEEGVMPVTQIKKTLPQ